MLLTGSFTDPDLNESHTVTVDWGDGVTSHPLAGGVRDFAISHEYPDGNSPFSRYSVVVTIADSAGNAVQTIVSPAPPADLSLAVTQATDFPAVGAELRYSLLVSNTGPADATNVQLTFNVPSGLTLDRVEVDGVGTFTPSGSQAVVDLGPLSVGGSRLAIVVFDAAVAGDYNLSLAISADQEEATPADNTQTVSTTVFSGTPADLSLAVTQATDFPAVGNELRYNLVVGNDGSADATNVQLTFNVPSGLTLDRVEVDGVGTFTPSGSQAVVDLGPLSVGGSRLAVVVFDAAVAGDYNLSLAVSADQEEATPADNTQTVSTTVRPSITVFNVVPVVTPPVDQAALEGASTQFSLGSFADPGVDDPWTVRVNWGDGSFDSFQRNIPGNLGTLFHTYADDGDYKVTVTASEAPIPTGVFFGGFELHLAGPSGSAAFQVTVAPVNDAPVIGVTGSDSAAETLTETDAGLTTAGTLSVEDLDTTDTVSVAVSAVAVLGADNGIGNAALLGMLAVGANPVIDNTSTTGTINWSFDSGSEAFNHLAVGESLVLTYTLTATDSQSAADTQDVVITINGSNDAPVIGVLGSDSAAETLTETGAGLTTAGTLSVEDLDTTDTVSVAVSAVAVVGADNGIGNAALLGMLAVGANPVIDNTSTAGTIDWSFDSGSEAFNHLAVGESLVLTYTLTATDSQNAADTQDVVITINGSNDAPVISRLESSHPEACDSSEDGSVSISGAFTDDDLSDTHTITVDWGDGSDPDNDGIVGEQSVDQTNDLFSGGHVYSSGGIYTITVTVDDGHGGQATDTAIAVVRGVGVVDGTLYVIGTDGRDHVMVKLGKNRGQEVVQVDAKLDQGPNMERLKRDYDLDDVQRIHMVLCDGNDHVIVHRSVTLPTYIDGGAGNDHLQGGSGPNILLGGPGNDVLKGGDGDDVLSGGDGDDKLDGDKGHDILIGGLGKDDLKGGHGDDLLIAMRWMHEENRAALEAIHAEWTRHDANYDLRRDHLTGATAGGLNGGFLLNGATLTDDGVKDKLKGDQGRDLFFATLGGSKKDKVQDDKSNEDILELDELL